MKPSHIVVIFSFLLASTAYSQSEVLKPKNFETWSSLGVKFYLGEKWAIGFEEQVRLKENSSILDQHLSQLEFNFKPSKKLDFALGLRHTGKNDNVGKKQGYENLLRLQFDVAHRIKIKRFTIKNRLRYQNRLEIDGLNQDMNSRIRTTLNYNIKNWQLDPKLAGELFFHTQFGDPFAYTKYRISFGTDYRIKKRHEIGLLYRFEKEVNTARPELSHILGLGYTFLAKKRKKKKV